MGRAPQTGPLYLLAWWGARGVRGVGTCEGHSHPRTVSGALILTAQKGPLGAMSATVQNKLPGCIVASQPAQDLGG